MQQANQNKQKELLRVKIKQCIKFPKIGILQIALLCHHLIFPANCRYPTVN